MLSFGELLRMFIGILANTLLGTFHQFGTLEVECKMGN